MRKDKASNTEREKQIVFVEEFEVDSREFDGKFYRFKKDSVFDVVKEDKDKIYFLPHHEVVENEEYKLDMENVFITKLTLKGRNAPIKIRDKYMM